MTAEPDRLLALGEGLRTAAIRYRTPAFVTDAAALEAAASELAAAFPDPIVRQYSLKANDVPAVVGRLFGLGLGANVVSGGEWAIARSAGVPNGRISFEGIGKSDRELQAAVRAAARGEPLAWLAVESPEETATLVRLARRAGLGRNGRPALDVLVRLNPDVVPETHAGLAVGAGASKFGMTETELTATVDAVSTGSGGAVRLRGVHLHVGSQLGAVDAWRDAVRRGLALLGLVRGGLDAFDTLDLGGGFPVAPFGEPAPAPGRFARELGPLLDAVPADRRPRRIAVEPGRFLVARSGWLIARVLHVRDRGGRQVILDAGMTELIRPALYGARHAVVALTSLGTIVPDPAVGEVVLATSDVARVEGPVCESTDHLGEHRLPPLERGDLVAIRDAGAYAASLASTYNGRPRAPQVMLEVDGTLRLVRRRGRPAGSLS